jgi:hypothetical protein
MGWGSSEIVGSGTVLTETSDDEGDKVPCFVLEEMEDVEKSC